MVTVNCDITTYRTIAERWHDIARQLPSHLAVTYGKQTLTYGEIDQQVNSIASALNDLVPETGHPVGYMFNPGWHPVAAMFGIARAGQLYAPMDLDTPPQRLKHILDYAGIEAVLVNTYTESLGLIPDGVQTINIEELSSPTSPPTARYSRYCSIHFTSGSTGTPKGVVHSHESVLAWTSKEANWFNLNETVKGGHLFNYGFTASRTMTYNIVLTGGHLHLYDVKLEGFAGIADWLKDHRISFVHMSPTMLREMIKEHPEGLNLPDLRYLMLGTEPLRRHDVQLFRETITGPGILVNRLGSTEAGPIAEYRIGPDTPIEHSFAPAGFPLEGHSTIALLDGDGKVMPDGTVGEIVLTGAHLCDGYWDKDTRNAKGMEVDAADPTRRILHTNDMAIRHADGLLEFLGRQGSVVKISGYRVDLGEVEEAMLSHPMTDRVIVVAIGEDGDKVLAGFYTAAEEISGSDMRKHLADLLTGYMVPRLLIQLPEIPLTATRKPDIKTLQALAVKHQERDAQNRADIAQPQSDIEWSLWKIWKAVFSEIEIGIHDDFFALGGKSIHAAQIMAGIRRDLNMNVSLSLLIQYSTIAELARVLHNEAVLEEIWNPVVYLKTSGSRPPLICVHGVRGNVIGFHDFAHELDADQPCIGIQARGLDGVSEPFTSFSDMISHHVEHLQRVQPEGPYYLSGYSFGGFIAYELAQRLSAAGHDIGCLILFDTSLKHSGLERDSILGVSGRTQRLLARMLFNPLRLFRMSAKHRNHVLSRKRRQWRNVIAALKWDFSQDHHDVASARIRKANHKARSEHTLQPYPGDIIFVQAAQNGMGVHRNKGDRYKPWAEFIEGNVEVIYLEGSHKNMFEDPDVIRQMAKDVNIYLERAQQPEYYSLRVTKQTKEPSLPTSR